MDKFRTWKQIKDMSAMEEEMSLSIFINEELSDSRIFVHSLEEKESYIRGIIEESRDDALGNLLKSVSL